MALLIILVLKGVRELKGPYGILRTWNWPITAREITQPYNNVEYATRHLYFPYTHEHLGECVYEENTSNKWYVPRYLTRKHCITTLSHS